MVHGCEPSRSAAQPASLPVANPVRIKKAKVQGGEAPSSVSERQRSASGSNPPGAPSSPVRVRCCGSLREPGRSDLERRQDSDRSEGHCQAMSKPSVRSGYQIVQPGRFPRHDNRCRCKRTLAPPYAMYMPLTRLIVNRIHTGSPPLHAPGINGSLCRNARAEPAAGTLRAFASSSSKGIAQLPGQPLRSCR
jgi:hypothetical protein